MLIAFGLCGVLVAIWCAIPSTPPLELIPLTAFAISLILGWSIGRNLQHPYGGALIGALVGFIPAYWLWLLLCQ